MRLRQLFTINLFLALFFGLSCSLAPAWVLGLYGLEPDAGLIWVTRRKSATAFSYFPLTA